MGRWTSFSVEKMYHNIVGARAVSFFLWSHAPSRISDNFVGLWNLLSGFAVIPDVIQEKSPTLSNFLMTTPPSFPSRDPQEERADRRDWLTEKICISKRTHSCGGAWMEFPVMDGVSSCGVDGARQTDFDFKWRRNWGPVGGASRMRCGRFSTHKVVCRILVLVLHRGFHVFARKVDRRFECA